MGTRSLSERLVVSSETEIDASVRDSLKAIAQAKQALADIVNRPEIAKAIRSLLTLQSFLDRIAKLDEELNLLQNRLTRSLTNDPEKTPRDPHPLPGPREEP